MVVPLSIKSTFGIIFPVFFALGTLVPLAVVIFVVSFGKSNVTIEIKALKKSQKLLRIAGGVILVVLGLLDSFIYWIS